MDFDFTTLPENDRYRLLTNFVGPRPIALVTTRSEDGHSNAAPMSFFNVFSHEPPLLLLGIQAKGDGQEKDTIVNIRRTGEFVVNMVDMGLADAMVVCGVNFSSDVDEVEFSGLTPIAGRRVGAVALAESPCSFECRVERIIDYARRAIVIGEVLHMRVKDSCMDPKGRYVDPAQYQPIARLHADNYITSDRQFELKKSAELQAFETGKLVAGSNRAIV